VGCEASEFALGVKFHQTLGGRDVSEESMVWMISGAATFNQPLDKWSINNATN
jgi:hypothetical protein